MKPIKKKRGEEIDRSDLSEPNLTSDEWKRFFEGVALFNERKFWEAHEAWEDVWKIREEDSRILFQAIIQAAAAYHLVLVKRRYVGAHNNINKALKKLELFSGRFLGIDVDDLRSILVASKSEMERLGADRFQDFPERLVPMLKVMRRVGGSSALSSLWPRPVHGEDAKLARCPQREDGGKTCDGTLLIVGRNHQAVCVCHEMQVVENSRGLTSLDPSMPEINLVKDHRLVTAKEFAERYHSLTQWRSRFAQVEEIRQVLIPQPCKSAICGFAEIVSAGQGELRFCPYTKAGHHRMKIENRLHGGLVQPIFFVVRPLLFQITPRKDSQDGFVLAVEQYEFSLFFLHSGDPVRPFLHAQQSRNPAPQVRDQFPPCRVSIVSTCHEEVAAEFSSCFCQLEFIRAGPPSGARKSRYRVFVCGDSECHEGVFQCKWPALPEVRLRVETHCRFIPLVAIPQNLDKV